MNIAGTWGEGPCEFSAIFTKPKITSKWSLIERDSYLLHRTSKSSFSKSPEEGNHLGHTEAYAPAAPLRHLPPTHSSIHGHLGYADLLAILNNVMADTGVQISQVPAVNSSACTPRSGVAGSYGNPIFSFWGTATCVPQRLYQCAFHQQCTRVPVPPHPCQHLLSGFFFFFNNSQPS